MKGEKGPRKKTLITKKKPKKMPIPKKQAPEKRKLGKAKPLKALQW